MGFLEVFGISCHRFIRRVWDLLLWVYYRGLGSFVMDIPKGLGGFPVMDSLEGFVISCYGFIRWVWESDGFIREICESPVMEILENFGVCCHGFIREVLVSRAMDLSQPEALCSELSLLCESTGPSRIPSNCYSCVVFRGRRIQK